jgi:hypothetical protein
VHQVNFFSNKVNSRQSKKHNGKMGIGGNRIMCRTKLCIRFDFFIEENEKIKPNMRTTETFFFL